MHPLPALAFYRTHGAFSDPGQHTDAINALPDDVAALAYIVRGLLIHSGWLQLYGLTAEDVVTMARETLPVAQRLDAIQSLQPNPLSEARPARTRAVGTCRDYALMLCAFLRHKAVPARVRCGYARYFKAGHNEDHWVCEYWHAQDGRWALADAQLDGAHCAHLSIRFNPIDLPEDQFIFAGQAWQHYRAGLADAASYGHGTATGPWFMRVASRARPALARQAGDVGLGYVAHRAGRQPSYRLGRRCLVRCRMSMRTCPRSARHHRRGRHTSGLSGILCRPERSEGPIRPSTCTGPPMAHTCAC